MSQRIKTVMPRRKGKGAQHPRLQRREQRAKPKRKSRRAENRRRNCYCDGWPWSARGGPHRIGSRASGDFTRATGASGCIHSMPRKAYIDPDTGAPF